MIGFRCMWHLHRRWRATTAPRQCAWWLHIQKTSCCCPLPRGLLMHAIANAHVTNSESQPSLLLSYAAEHERTTIYTSVVDTTAPWSMTPKSRHVSANAATRWQRSWYIGAMVYGADQCYLDAVGHGAEQRVKKREYFFRGLNVIFCTRG